MASSLPELPPFDPDEDPSLVPLRWKRYLRNVDMSLLAADIADHKRRWAYLLRSAGEKVQILEEHLEYAKGGDDTDHYKALHEALTTHFEPKKNTSYAAFQFRSLKQEEGEPIDSFVIRLRDYANRCDYGDLLDRMIRDQIIFSCSSGKMRRKALAEDLDLKQLIAAARAEESARSQASDIEKDSQHTDKNVTDSNVFRIHRTPGKYSARLQHAPAPPTPPHPSTGWQARPSKCGWCGRSPSHARPTCPAIKSTCSGCQKIGHWAAVCRSKEKKKVFYTQEQEVGNNPDVGDFEGLILNRVIAINSLNPTAHPTSRHVPISVNGNCIFFRPDSGSDADVITAGEYHKMSPRPPLHASNHILYAYGAEKPLKAIGAFNGTASIDGKSVRTTFHVVQLPGRWCCLLSEETSIGLDLIVMKRMPTSINNVTTSAISRLVDSYDDICHGIGCHKHVVVSLPMDETVKPVAAPPARVPFHMLPGLKKELERLQKKGAIEDVPVDDTNQWISRMVPVPRKVEGSDKPGIRITIDWRNVNKGLEKVHHSMLTLEQLRYDLNGARVFSHIDLKDVFSQLPLDESSRKITTFSTPWGLKRMTRLVQGALPSSAIFHETLRRDLEGLNNVLNVADNVVVWGCGNTKEEAEKDHLLALENVLDLFRRKGLTINKPKCIFGASSISFFGYIFSENGVSPDPAKIAALRDATPPESKEDVRSFLGMSGFNQQFIPNYATVSEPLRRLTTKEARFEWGPEQQAAFRHMKRALEETALLSFFCPNKRTVLFTDASPVGIHATLAQEEDDGAMRPISFASRALSPTEQGYVQIEREALAMHFGCHRYQLFLRGAPFTHFIDPETLKPMMENPRKDAPARIERIRLKLQGYDAAIKLIPGKKNPADYLSRHPLSLNTCSKAELLEYSDIENYIFYITSCLPDAITLS